MVYIFENNGVYGLTKGQFSATADKGSKSKRGAVNTDSRSIWCAWRCCSARPSWRAASPATRTQLVPLLKAAIAHNGAAFLDVISPCVAFNNHPGSTKSFDFVREHNEAVNRLDFITAREPIHVDYEPGTVEMVTQHDGSVLRLRKVAADYDLHDRSPRSTTAGARESGRGRYGSSLSRPRSDDLHELFEHGRCALERARRGELIPGSEALDRFNRSLR